MVSLHYNLFGVRLGVTIDGEALANCITAAFASIPSCEPQESTEIRVSVRFGTAFRSLPQAGLRAVSTTHSKYFIDSKNGTYLGVTPGIGCAHIDVNRSRVDSEVWIYGAEWERSIVRYLILDPLWLLLPQRAMLICHGALLKGRGDRSVLLLGRSGMGKTTTCMRLCASDASQFSVLADDTCVLTEENQLAYAYPLHTGFGYCAGEEARWGARPDNWEPWFEAHDKTYYRHIPYEGHGLGRVVAVVILHTGARGEAAIRRVSADRGVRGILGTAGVIPFPYAERIVAMWARVCAAVPVWEVDPRAIQSDRDLNFGVGHIAEAGAGLE